jgi:hypothetical protein
VNQRYHLTLTTPATGTVMEGWWASRATAERKFRSVIGSYGSIPGARVTLAEGLDDETEQVAKSWPDET